MRGAKVGRNLHRIIRRLTGLGIEGDCDCLEWIRKMNQWGPAGCREHLDEIVAHIRSETKHRGWWRYATMVPGSGPVLRRIVLTAITEAERARE